MGVHEREIIVRVDGGLHARPISEVVRISKGFKAKVSLCAKGREALTASSLKMLMLGVREGEAASLRGTGEDAGEAIAALARYLEGAAEAPAEAEPAEAEPVAAEPEAGPAPRAWDGARAGIAVSAGLGLGPVHLFRQPALDPEPEAPGATPAVARDRLRGASAAVAARLRGQAGQGASPASAEILTALADFAEDPDWLAEIAARIEAGSGALAALEAVSARMAAQIAAMEDPYAASRAEDLRAAAHLVALEMQGKRPADLGQAPDGAVILAEELTAVDLGGTDMARFAGLATAAGAANGHAAILARTYGLPCVFGLGAEGLAALTPARALLVDGSRGEVLADPGPELRARVAAEQAAARAEAEALAAFRTVRPRLASGRAVTVAANIGGTADLDAAKAAGAMGVGLMRTEFLFLGRMTLPGEQEQYETYRAVLQAFPDDPVVIRTLDIGGDKPARAIAVLPEENPFLGLRGIRLCLARPALFRTQLRALLRAARHGRLEVMLPMVSTVEEITRTREEIETARAELETRGEAYGRFRLGIMIETPAAVLQAAELAAQVDFFSIGTNDLTQYVMAADRMNPAVAGLCRADNPAVLAAIRATCAAAARAGIPVAVCGEAGADAALIPQLLSAGVQELSVSIPSVLRVKRQVEGLHLPG
jgi:phosphocarrier protein FPr